MKNSVSPDINKISTILASLSREEKIGQILVPLLFTLLTPEQNEKEIQRWKSFTEKNGLGGFFFIKGETAVLNRFAQELQKANAKVPPLIAADLESGPGRFNDCTTFPDLLALGAAGDKELAYTMGKSTAQEGLTFGVNWTYTPVLDIYNNPDNPITVNRCYGDNPETISLLSQAHIRGLQDHGIAACIKHFPGDGMDSRDQHLCTTVNHLSMDEWMNTYGKLFKESIDAGVWTVMVGHIALPAWDDEKSIYDIPQPATLSKKLITGLLRENLGFDGLVVSDAMGMGGVTGSLDRKERITQAFNAGNDMLLFTELQDFNLLLQSLEEGIVSEERLDEAVTRVLELKQKLGLLDNYRLFADGPSQEERETYRQAAVEVAQRSIVPVRNDDAAFPIKENGEGKRALMVSLCNKHQELVIKEDDPIRELLKGVRDRGYEVEHILNPDHAGFEHVARNYDRVFVNFFYPAEWGVGSTRSVGAHNRMFMSDFLREGRGKTIFTSFANPYHLHDFPQLPNYINVHSMSEPSQKAAVLAWFGEIDIQGNKSPVKNLSRFS